MIWYKASTGSFRTVSTRKQKACFYSVIWCAWIPVYMNIKCITVCFDVTVPKLEESTMTSAPWWPLCRATQRRSQSVMLKHNFEQSSHEHVQTCCCPYSLIQTNLNWEQLMMNKGCYRCSALFSQTDGRLNTFLFSNLAENTKALGFWHFTTRTWGEVRKEGDVNPQYYFDQWEHNGVNKKKSLQNTINIICGVFLLPLPDQIFAIYCLTHILVSPISTWHYLKQRNASLPVWKLDMGVNNMPRHFVKALIPGKQTWVKQAHLNCFQENQIIKMQNSLWRKNKPSSNNKSPTTNISKFSPELLFAFSVWVFNVITLHSGLHQWAILIYVRLNQTYRLEVYRHHEWEKEPHIAHIRGPTISLDRRTMEREQG